MSERLATVESLMDRFPSVPREAVLKEDLLRTGIAFSRAALSDNLDGTVKPKSYFIFSFDQQPLAGEDEQQDRRPQKEQKQHDRKQCAGQRGPLGCPVKNRRQNIGDDAGQHEGQQNQFDEIEKDREDERADHDGARFPGIERAGGAGALDGALLVAALTWQFHE